MQIGDLIISRYILAASCADILVISAARGIAVAGGSGSDISISINLTFPFAQQSMTEAQLADPLKRGLYLATIGHCFECHTPMERGRRLYKTAFGVGGFRFEGPFGESFSRNITSHPEKGIGGWTDDEIKRAITKGIRKDGSR